MGQILPTFGEAPPKRFALLQFADRATAQSFWTDPKLENLLKTGQKYATYRNYAVEGLAQ